LNIVGEKDMECAVCKRGVADFKLSTAGKLSGSAGLMINRAEKEKLERKDFTGKSFMDPLFSSPGSAAESGAVKCVAEDTGTNVDGERLLPSAFDGEFDGSIGSEHGFQFFDFENAREASTPIPTELDNRAKGGRERVADNVVLRIDNVPWVSSVLLSLHISSIFHSD
jgi:hypothetical protein